MKPSVWSYYFHSSPEEMTRQFASKGFEQLELSDEHGKALLERGAPAKAGAEFAQFAAGHGVSFPQGHLWLTCDIAGLRQADVLEAMKSWLDLFVAVGVKAAVLHPGGHELQSKGASADDIRDSQVRALRQIVGHLRGSGMIICLENMHSQVAGDLLALIDAAGKEGLAICLDTGHLNLDRGDQGRFIREAGANLKALHLADNDGSSDQHLMPFGRGNVKWSEVFAALRETNYDGLYNFEIPGETQNCPDSVRMAKLDYIKAIWPALIGQS